MAEITDKRQSARSRIRAWREYPAQFVWDNFRVEPDAWQREGLDAVGGSYNPRRQVGFKACTGPGKTAMLAWIGWHRLACFSEPGEHPKGAALSINRDNLRDNLWPELAKWQRRSPFLMEAFTWTKEQIYANDHSEDFFLSARSFAKDADADAIGRALSGLHGKFPFVLLDETGDMPVSVGRTAEQIFTGSPVDALIMAGGNPSSINGLLYHICTKARESWKIITVTADPDDPNRTPRVDADYARQQIEEHGRDNPWVMATFLGLFPPAGFNALIGAEDLEQSMKRVYQLEDYAFAPKILGVDVAREGDDPSVICPRQGLVAFKPKVFRNIRSNVLAGHIAQAEDKWAADGVIIDGTGGWGAGVIDAGANINRFWFDCQFAGKPFSPKFANKRAEILFTFAEWVKNGGALPYLPQLLKEFPQITYSFQGDKMLVEPKAIIKARIGSSTDYTDGYATTFAFPIAAKHKGAQMQKELAGNYDPTLRLEEYYRGVQTRGDYNPIGA